jgi:hypothetical protein
MKERPILFSSPMVRAILAGRKTQTRRARGLEAINQGDGCYDALTDTGIVRVPHTARTIMRDFRCPYGVVGDRLWVRETWATLARDDKWSPRDLGPGGVKLWYAADGDDTYNERGKWRPSIHMPRWASRITLEIVRVGAGRLWEISEEDAIAEGVLTLNPAVCAQFADARSAFAHLWQSINGSRPGCSWSDNPWCWRISFRRLETEVCHG